MKIKLRSTGACSSTLSSPFYKSKRTLEDEHNARSTDTSGWQMPDAKVSSWSFCTWENKETSLSQQPLEKQRLNDPEQSSFYQRRLRPSLNVSDLNSNWRNPLNDELAAKLHNMKLDTFGNQEIATKPKEVYIPPPLKKLEEPTIEIKPEESSKNLNNKISIKPSSSCQGSEKTFLPFVDSKEIKKETSVPMAVYLNCVRQRDVKIQQLENDLKEKEEELFAVSMDVKEKAAELLKCENQLQNKNSLLDTLDCAVKETAKKLYHRDSENDANVLKIQSMQQKLDDVNSEAKWLRGELHKKMIELRKLKKKPESDEINQDLVRQNTNLTELLREKNNELQKKNESTCISCSALKNEINQIRRNEAFPPLSKTVSSSSSYCKKCSEYITEIRNLKAFNGDLSKAKEMSVQSHKEEVIKKNFEKSVQTDVCQSCLELKINLNKIQAQCNNLTKEKQKLEKQHAATGVMNNSFLGIEVKRLQSILQRHNIKVPTVRTSPFAYNTLKDSSLLPSKVEKDVEVKKSMEDEISKLTKDVQARDLTIKRLEFKTKTYISEISNLTMKLHKLGVSRPSFFQIEKIQDNSKPEDSKHVCSDWLAATPIQSKQTILENDYTDIVLNDPVKNILSYSIQNIKQKVFNKNEKKLFCFLTEMFYTGRPGYKCQFCVRINGLTISFDFRILQGVFDKVLTWPFNLNLSLAVFNNSMGKKCLTIISSDEIPLKCCQLPPSVGSPIFIGSKSVDVKDFVGKDDVLYFELFV